MKIKQIVTLFIAVVFSLNAFAKKDPDDYYVQVLLENGDTITGYIHNDLKTGLKNIFSKTGSIRQYINLGEELNGGKTKRYSASEVKEYRFLEPTEGYPEGATCVSEMVNSPVPFKPLNYVRGFLWERDRRDSGSILKWEMWDSPGGANSVRRLVPVIGVKLKGAPATFPIIYNGGFNDWYVTHYLKKTYPELLDAWDQYYHKGEDAKAHRKELLDNPSTALLFYEDFLSDNPPLDDDKKKK